MLPSHSYYEAEEENLRNQKQGELFMGKLIPQRYSIRELPTYFSLFWSKKSSMICTTQYSFLLNPQKRWVTWGNFKFESVFTLLLFFINLHTATE